MERPKPCFILSRKVRCVESPFFSKSPLTPAPVVRARGSPMWD
ncbi:unnamed protein product, partial [Vitis vinifera]|uniref:Uncharacterized protein n=1 Tax=Vitis vinifera TaxID=29760 RepID=D7TQL0_VITVI